MGAHAVAGQDQDHSGDDIALRCAVAATTQPHAHEPCRPPDDPHAGVLQVVAHPRSAPAVFGEGVNAAPRRDNRAVEELLAAARAAQPELPNEQQ